MQHSKHKGSNLKSKITASLLSLAILGTGTVPLVSTVVATAAEAEESVGATEVAIGTDNGAGVYWANATYFDYLSDNELSRGWRNNIQAGTGHSGSQDNWYPFYQFNSFLSGIAGQNSGWSSPLYFGNFYNGSDNPYANSNHGGPYNTATNGLTRFQHTPNNSEKKYDGTGLSDEHQSYQGLVQSQLKNGKLMVTDTLAAPYFDEAQLGSYAKVFKSSFPFTQEVKSDYTKYSFQSSTNNNRNAADNVYFTYDGSGNPTSVNYGYGSQYAVKDGKRYFMYNDSSGYGIFPFNGPGEEKTGTYTRYIYASADNTKDSGNNRWTRMRCYFYNNSGTVGTAFPGDEMTKDSNGDYKLKIPANATDAIITNYYDSNNRFPEIHDLSVGAYYVDEHWNLNTWPEAPSDAGTTNMTYTYNTEKLDYGFGVRMDVKFRVPGQRTTADGRVIAAGKSEDGTRISFDFAGDDDLWMFITDETTKESQLLLDMGGNHKKSEGHVYFDTLEAKVNQVYGSGSSSKTFNFDYSHTYTMTVFYMERGLIESNCDMSFTMTPLGNNFIVTETIDTTNVNEGLKDAVSGLDSFNFTPSQNGSSSWTNGLSYNVDGTNYNKSGKNSVDLKSGQTLSIANFFSINDQLSVKQTHGDSLLKYATRYTYKNNTTGQPLGNGVGVYGSSPVSTRTGYLSNTGTAQGDPYEFAELQADFVNTPQVKDVTVTKETLDYKGDELTTGVGTNEEFSVQALVKLTANGSWQAYDLEYTSDEGDTGTATGGRFTIKGGETVTFPNMPVGAKIKFVETLSDGSVFEPDHITYDPEELTIGSDADGNLVTISNYRVPPEDTEVTLSVDKSIVTETHQRQNGATLADGYTFELLCPDYTGDEVLQTITITDPDDSQKSMAFEPITFTAETDEIDWESVFYTYGDPDGETFTFVIREKLTDAQKQVISEPDPQEIDVTVYYDKDYNRLTLVPPEQVGSVPDPDTSSEFVNPYRVANLEITKTVVNPDGALTDEDQEKEFDATVTFTFNGNTYPDGVPFYYFTSDDPDTVEKLGNSQTIKLKNGRTVYFQGLPVGTVVSIREIPDSEYSVTYQPQQVEIVEQGTVPITMGVTNTRQKSGNATLGVKKILENSDVSAKAGVTLANAGFKFKLTETTSATSAYTETVTATGESVMFSAIPFTHAETRTFTIEEIPGNLVNVVYDTVKYNVSVTATKNVQTNELEITNITYKDEDGATVYTTNTGVVNPMDDAFGGVFINSYMVGDVRFDKRVFDETADDAASDSTEFTVKVQIKYPGDADYSIRPFSYVERIGETPTVKSCTDGNVTVVKDGTYTITDLPVGTLVSIEETDSKGYLKYCSTSDPLVATDPRTGGTADAPNSKATIINQKVSLPVSIEAQKKTEGFALKAGDFEFTLDGAVKQTKTNGANGKVTFDTLTYEVRSDNKPSAGNTIVLSAADFIDGKYTDTFTISEIPGNNAFITYDGAVYQAIVTITATPDPDIEGLCSYAAAVSYADKDGKPLTAAPAFTNSWKRGSAEISKVVKDYDGEVLTDLSGLSFKVNVSYTYPTGYTKSATDVDTAEVTLNERNSFKAKLNDLPYGTTVSISEDSASAAGYTVTYNPQSGTIGSTTLALEVDNRRQNPNEVTFPVAFEKQLTDYELAEGEFTFKLNGAGYEADTQQTNKANGQIDFGTVTVRYAKTATDADLENHIVYLTDADFNASGVATLAYEAVEVGGSDGSIVYDQATIVRTATIQKTVTATQTTLAVTKVEDVRFESGEPVEQAPVFVNRKVGPVSVTKETKKIDETGAVVDYDTDQTFTATVTFKLPNAREFEILPFTYQMSDVNGIFTPGDDGKVELKNHRTITFAGLPYGTQMKVVEDANPNYTTAYSAETAQVGGQTAEITVTNTLQQPGQAVLPVTKSFTDNALNAGVNKKDKNNKFTFTMTADSSNPVVSDYSSAVTFDQYNDKDELITTGSFAPINFPADFAYSPNGTRVKFSVAENKAIAGNDGNIIYDTASYTVVYTVKQTADGLSVSEPAITKDGKSANAVIFTNDYKTGGVKIVKALEDYDGKALDESLAAGVTFPVTATVALPNGDSSTVNSVIGLNKTFEINDLPLGTTVSVEETDTNGMTLKGIEPASVTIGETAQVITVTNKRTDVTNTSTVVEARKTLKGDALAKGDFHFSLTGNGVNAQASNDADGKVTFAPIVFAFEGTNPETTVQPAGVITLKKADFATVSTKDYYFTLTEVRANRADILFDTTSYTVKITVTVDNTLSKLSASAPAVVTADQSGVPLSFTNEKKGSATVRKIVTQTVDGEDKPFDTTTKFDIDVTLTYPDGNTDSETVSLGANESKTYENLPIGTKISVVEKDAKGFAVSYQPQEDTVKLSDENTVINAAVTVKNHRPEPTDTEATLSVIKNLKGDTLTDGQFRFTAVGAGFAEEGVTAVNTGANVTFPKITYKYTEGTEQDDTDNHIVYVRAADFDDNNQLTFTYSVTEDATYNHDDNMLYDSNKVITASVVITKSGTDQVTISAAQPVYTDDATFVNTKLAEFSLKKVVKRTDDTGAIVDIQESDADYQQLANHPFTVKFFVTLPGEQEKSMKYAVTRDGKDEPMTEIEEGVYGFTIKHNETLVIPALPVGTKVRFTEAADSNYKVDSQTLTIGKDASANVVTLTNILQAQGKGYASVNKAFTPNAIKAGLPDTNKNTYHFNLSYSGNTAGVSYNETVSINGETGWSASFPAITFPADLDYSGDGIDFVFLMKETAATTTDSDIVVDTDTFTLTYNVKQGDEGLVVTGPVIKKNGETDADTATFYNGYRLGDVTVEKALEDFDGSVLTADAMFPVTLTATYANGDTESVNGEIGFKNGEKQLLTVKDLPRGTKVTVTETDTKGMTLKSIEPAEVTIGETAQVITVTNKRTELNPTYVQLAAQKTLEGADLSKYENEFVFNLTGNGISLTGKNTAEGVVTFDTINFRIRNGADDVAEENTILIDKTAFAESNTISYFFTVSEIPADRADISFDGSTQMIKVNITKTETLGSISLTASIDPDSSASFVNTKLGKVKLTKTVLDINGAEITPDVNFVFKAEADGKVIDDNIIINLSSAETSTYTTPFLPVGTLVTFTETDKAGFENTDDVKSVTVTDDTDGSEPASVSFTNKRPQPGQTAATLSVVKLTEGFKLSDNDFTFTAKGRGLDESKTNAANGTVSFSEITYQYTKGTETDTGSTVYLHDDDFNAAGQAKLSYTIAETKGSNPDVIYADNTVTAEVTVTKTETASTITLSAKVEYPDGRSFTNKVRDGSVTIIKKDQNDAAVDGVEFTLFKVASDGLGRDDVLANGVVVDRKTTENGQVTFAGLELYVNANQTLGDPARQWYCFAETNAGDNHNLNSELTFFQLPQEDVYDVEFTYMNGKITTPTSGGHGMFAFKLAGSILVFLAALALAGYVFFVKAPTKKSARHSVKK